MVLNISRMIKAKTTISINSSIRCHPLSGLYRISSLLKELYNIFLFLSIKRALERIKGFLMS